MAAMDITALQFPDESFDAVICHHVLEHIPDDRKALAELYRVMKPGGWGSISVPMKGAVTLEDPSIVDPERRRQLFGQADHVRQYGWDFLDRLRAKGFTVRVFEKSELAEPFQLERLSVACETAVVLVVKPAALSLV
jgi:SAM-dependent methyltransferase